MASAVPFFAIAEVPNRASRLVVAEGRWAEEVAEFGLRGDFLDRGLDDRVGGRRGYAERAIEAGERLFEGATSS